MTNEELERSLNILRATVRELLITMEVFQAQINILESRINVFDERLKEN